ncbi:kinase-like domain-containing protein [Lophiotrema nucula]|uniref:Kinase-like domain-containing protein n=1 Tax=Lophiotrema nucula TaxID=690887 RepID=A0A6A5ZN27_9PLEO|nr:kinase-like domain-containing protein [Lophiotrema nucula]
MHLLQTLVLPTLFQQTIAVPLGLAAPPIFPPHAIKATGIATSTLSIFERLYPLKRGIPPPECADKDATEEQGCFTLKDASGNDVHFALAPGQSFATGIGSGNGGSVAHCVLADGRDIAVKQYGRAKMEAVEKEFAFMQELKDNEHIVTAIALGNVQGKPSMAMELLDGDITTRVKEGKWKGKENEKAMKDFANQVLDALAYMHSKDITHSDLFLRNIAFKGDTAKIIDFDWAHKGVKFAEKVPMADWGRQAPEGYVDLKIPEPRPKMNIDLKKNDVWAIANVFLYMTTGVIVPKISKPEMRAIWEPDDSDKRVEQIKKRWPDFTPEFAELLGDIFCKQDDRLTMEKFKEDFADVKIYC